jgi:cytochrome oxidase assembly protein ShyY1
MPIRFRFRLVPFIATVLLVALGIALGNWQKSRADQKTALRDRMAQRSAQAPLVLGAAPASLAALEYRRVSVTGEFVPNWPVFLDNRPYQGRVGFYLVMPFRITNSDMHVLVARGWLPRDPADPRKLPAYATPAGQVTIEGTVTGSVGHLMQLGTPARLQPGAIVQNVTPADVAQASGLAVQPFFVQQAGPQEAGIVRDWPLPSTGIEKHQGYAFQWYALAVMAGLFFVITGFRSGTNSHRRTSA